MVVITLIRTCIEGIEFIERSIELKLDSKTWCFGVKQGLA